MEAGQEGQVSAGGAAPTPPEVSADRPLDHAPVQIPLERRQLIGVSSEEVQRRPLEKVIRTVGRVEID